MNRVDAKQMIQWRAEGLVMKVRIGCHTFQANGIEACLEAKGTVENAQAMTAYVSSRAMTLYIESTMKSRLMNLSELLLEDGQRRLTRAGRRGLYLATEDPRSSGEINPRHHPIHHPNSFGLRSI